MKNINDRILVYSFFAFIYLFSALLLLSPGGKISERDNRVLTKRPEISISSIASGDFMKQTANFASDNIPLREQMISAKAISEIMMLKFENNKIIFGKDGYLVEKPEYHISEIEKSMFQTDLLKERLHSKDIKMHAFILPFSGDGKSSMLPIRQYTNDYSVLGDYYVSARHCMYYKTDHHLNFTGSETLYGIIADALCIDKRDFDRFLLTDSFLGRSYYTSGIPKKKNEIILSPINDYEISTYIDNEFAYNGFIDYSKLSTQDKYSAFFGGNHAQCYVYNPKNERTLIVIKDSYALSICPFLIKDYNILMLDMRYTKRELSYYIDNYDCSDLIILCGSDSFSSTAYRRFITL